MVWRYLSSSKNNSSPYPLPWTSPPPCNTLQSPSCKDPANTPAILCKTALQCLAIPCNPDPCKRPCNTVQTAPQPAIHCKRPCNTLQYPPTPCNALQASAMALRNPPSHPTPCPRRALILMGAPKMAQDGPKRAPDASRWPLRWLKLRVVQDRFRHASKRPQEGRNTAPRAPGAPQGPPNMPKSFESIVLFDVVVVKDLGG